MHRLKVMLALLLLASCGVPLAGAAGVGTFSIEQTTVGVGVGQFGIATLYMDNTWQPPADSVILTLSWDPAVLAYVSTDWQVGNSVAATPSGNNQLQLQFADYTNKYPGGRVPVAAINFRGVQAGQSTMSISIQSVRSHVGISETEFTELTQSALSNPGIFTVGPGGGTVVPTVPVGTTPTVEPTVTGEVSPTVTVEPNVTGTVEPTLTIEPNVTGTITQPTTITTAVPTGITTGVPFVPPQGVNGGSEDYTGVLTRTPTVTVTRTATPTATVTGNVTPDTGNVTITMTPGINVTPTVDVTPTVNVTGTPITTAPGATTPGATTVPITATPTAAGLDVLPLAVAGLAALALIAMRRR